VCTGGVFPADCFLTVYEAARLAIKFMTPVICMSDGYLGNGAEPWRIPDVAELPPIPVTFAKDPAGFQPYSRDPVTLGAALGDPRDPRSRAQDRRTRKAGHHRQHQLRS